MTRSNHGGARKGAGRPRAGVAPKVKTSAAIDPQLLQEVAEKAQRLGLSRNAAIEEALRLWVTAIDD